MFWSFARPVALTRLVLQVALVRFWWECDFWSMDMTFDVRRGSGGWCDKAPPPPRTTKIMKSMISICCPWISMNNPWVSPNYPRMVHKYRRKSIDIHGWGERLQTFRIWWLKVGLLEQLSGALRSIRNQTNNTFTPGSKIKQNQTNNTTRCEISHDQPRPGQNNTKLQDCSSSSSQCHCCNSLADPGDLAVGYGRWGGETSMTHNELATLVPWRKKNDQGSEETRIFLAIAMTQQVVTGLVDEQVVQCLFAQTADHNTDCLRILSSSLELNGS